MNYTYLWHAHSTSFMSLNYNFSLVFSCCPLSTITCILHTLYSFYFIGTYYNISWGLVKNYLRTLSHNFTVFLLHLMFSNFYPCMFEWLNSLFFSLQISEAVNDNELMIYSFIQIVSKMLLGYIQITSAKMMIRITEFSPNNNIYSSNDVKQE
jgi:hypothetical protein